MLRLAGKVTRFESKPWDMDGRNGVSRKATILVSETDVHVVTLHEGIVDPKRGQVVDWAVHPSAAYGKLRLDCEGSWADVYADAK